MVLNEHNMEDIEKKFALLLQKCEMTIEGPNGEKQPSPTAIEIIHNLESYKDSGIPEDALISEKAVDDMIKIAKHAAEIEVENETKHEEGINV